MSQEPNHGSEPKPSPSDKPPAVPLQPVVRRFSISDYGAAAIGEGIAFAGLCIGLGIYGAEMLWILVIMWVFSFGPCKSLRDKPTSNPKVRGGAQSSDVAKQEEQDHA